jgi:hypothetical protein
MTMKKIVTGVAIFIIVFALTVMFSFPYSEYLNSMCDRMSKEGTLAIAWERSTDNFPSVKLYNVQIVSDEKLIACFDRVDMQLKPGSLTFKAAKNDCKVNGQVNLQELSYSFTNLPIPEAFNSSIGKGVLTVSGSYNMKAKKGKGKFEATIDQFPNPLVSGSLAIKGETSSENQKTSLVFTLKGKSFDGKGTITITRIDAKTPATVAGVLELSVGTMPIILNVGGNLDNITITKAQ